MCIDLRKGNFNVQKFINHSKSPHKGQDSTVLLLQKNGNMKFVGEAWSVSSYAFQVIACCFEGKQLLTLFFKITQLLIPSPRCLTLALNVPLFFLVINLFPCWSYGELFSKMAKQKFVFWGSQLPNFENKFLKKHRIFILSSSK